MVAIPFLILESLLATHITNPSMTRQIVIKGWLPSIKGSIGARIRVTHVNWVLQVTNWVQIVLELSHKTSDHIKAHKS